MKAVQRYRIASLSFVGLISTFAYVSFWGTPGIFTIGLGLFFAAATGGALFSSYRLLHRKQLQVVALQRQVGKVTAAAHQFIVERIIDLRQPLQGLVSIQDLYRSEAAPAEHRDYLEIADFCSRYVIRQLERLQYFAELESDSSRMAKASFSLRNCVRVAIGMASEQANNRSITVNEDWSPYVPDLVDGNEFSLRKLLVEALDNSIRYSGGHSVTLRVIPDPDQAPCVRFVVTDQGPGLSDKQLEYLKTPMSGKKKSVPWTNARESMGFTIIKKILHIAGGNIHVESKKGVGTTFSFVLPETALQVTRRLASRVSHNGNGINALIVDDEAITRQVVSGLLKKICVTSVLVENDPKAAQKFREDSFDVVFLDIDKPGADTAKAILESVPAGKQKPVIVALTTQEKKSDQIEYKELGITEFLLKPVNLDQITETFSRLGFAQTAPMISATATATTNLVSLDDERRKRQAKKVLGGGYYINFDKLFNALDENLVLCTDILRQVSRELDSGVEALATALKNDNRHEIKVILNKLYGELMMIHCDFGIKAVQKMDSAATLPGAEALQNSFEEVSDAFDKIMVEIERITDVDTLSA